MRRGAARVTKLQPGTCRIKSMKYAQILILCATAGFVAVLTGCGESAASAARIYNREAVIPPQCYTRTEGVHNPCYTCHQSYADKRPNAMNDGGLQGLYAFSDFARTNHWDNLFASTGTSRGLIRDSDIRGYIAEDNYAPLRRKLRGAESGFAPDLANYADPARAFDAAGMARDGSGWVAFNYKPFPGTFWPTNGSTDDVVIRLPHKFREIDGRPSRRLYLLNLSLLEMAIKDLPVLSIPPTDETEIHIDLDGNGMLTRDAVTLKRSTHYLGDAVAVDLEPQLYPVGTEFMHSVRYLGFDLHGAVGPSRRFKELRYMRKIRYVKPSLLSHIAVNEYREKADGRLPGYPDFGARGLDNGRGWQVLGFIEARDGSLRRQTHEEQMFCMGCHATIGTTIDQTFAFPRKVDGAAGWGYPNLHGMPDAPSRGAAQGEFLTWLERVGGGSEFRNNPEMRSKWFDAEGRVRRDAVRNTDVYTLVTPSPRRALELDKAYYLHVLRQDYTHGRDPVLQDAENVYRELPAKPPAPLQPGARIEGYDIRLDWQPLQAR